MICTPPSPSVADRVRMLTTPFPDDAHLKAWAARMIAAADLGVSRGVLIGAIWEFTLSTPERAFLQTALFLRAKALGFSTSTGPSVAA